MAEAEKPPEAEGVSELEAKLAEAEAKLAEAHKVAEENWDKFLRARADLENYIKRSEREVERQVRRAKADLLLRVLEVTDNLELALKQPEGGGDAFRSGVEIIYRQLGNLLRAAGVTPIDAVGQPFDPAVHEAVVVWESEDAAGETVSDEIQKGYMFEGEVLRPARVRVVRPQAGAEGEAGQEPQPD